ncbi:unnamed protein product [Didymodactylos carnosus]|uniref:Uncharacterized protein n=1 Tax=Didymodactylos carnosus TaxID=1234261 RepID=A0A815YN39_9BILA|nr:unnamed protein product [Didymodactylos carnosus]CAF1572124.1 unnamed protein product [Didymodactylos carnosus]CAF4246932.1 unnamed protein product [Didymodactylos carnosus]CAF4435772.1 unnamed protein product [Didymodactylos carnosus]
MVAPRSNVKASKYYHGIIQAKISPKTNSTSVLPPSFHFSAAQVKYGRELASLFSDEIIDISYDNKAKILVGTLAVSGHHQIRKFHMTHHALNYQDHDFPTGAKITPAVYMEIRHNLRSQSDDRHKHAKPFYNNSRSRSCSESLLPDSRDIITVSSISVRTELSVSVIQ